MAKYRGEEKSGKVGKVIYSSWHDLHLYGLVQDEKGRTSDTIYVWLEKEKLNR